MENPDVKYEKFVEFLAAFIRELNEVSEEGSAVLVEGKRDAEALVKLGYVGEILTSSAVASGKTRLRGLKLVMILTDLDSEGRRMASRYVKIFSTIGVRTSLTARRRLSKASRGRFLHVENLIRFAPLLLDMSSESESLRASRPP